MTTTNDDAWLRNSISIPGPFKIPSRDRMYARFIESAMSFPKMFLSGFLWEGFGLGSGYGIEYAGFYFITGLGGGIGTFLGHIIVYAIMKGKEFNVMEELTKGALYGLAVFLGPSTLWQKLTNDMEDWGWGFNRAFFFMWFISGLVFFVSMTFFRGVAQAASPYIPQLKVVETVSTRFWSDMSLSVSVGLGDAFFLGTVPGQFQPNPLGPAFGAHDDTNAFEAMLKAGTSVLLGFVIMQVIENMLLRRVWTDDARERAELEQRGVRDGDIEATTHSVMH